MLDPVSTGAAEPTASKRASPKQAKPKKAKSKKARPKKAKSKKAPAKAVTAKKGKVPDPAGVKQRTRRTDVLSVLKQMGGDSINIRALMKKCNGKVILGGSVERHVFAMRNCQPPLVTCIKHEGKGNENEEVTITKSGLKVLEGLAT